MYRVPGFYVYERSGSKGGGSSAAFNPKTYVDGIWSSKIVPTVHQEAVDVTTLPAAIADDPEAAGQKYDHRAGTGSLCCHSSGTPSTHRRLAWFPP
jgi:hypothetical protein